MLPYHVQITQNREISEYLAETAKIFNQDYHKPHIITDDDDWGKLVPIIEAFQAYDSTIKTEQLNLGKKALPNHLLIINSSGQYVIGFSHMGGSSFTNRIKNFNQLVNSNDSLKFFLLRDHRENPITGKVGKEEIEKLNYTKNGQFMVMDQYNRVVFELIYKLILDIKEGDLEVNLETAISVLISEYQNYWLINLLFSA